MASDSGQRRRRMLSLEEIHAGLAEVASLAREAQVSIALVGGVALYHYGSDRLTADIDFAAARHLASLPEEAPLSFGGYQSRTPGGVPVDWIVRDDDYAELFAEAVEYARDMDGVPVPVASPEYLVAMKMVARRKKDAADLDTLLLSGTVDFAKARRIVRRLLGPYAAEDLDSAAAEAKWRHDTGRG